MPFKSENRGDPRQRLVRDKYFNIRPRPLERWFWAQGIPASAERVFWLHWQEGLQQGNWCSEIPLRRVARECHLDVSTVTRAYQLLAKLGCIRRTDPGRDPANPFHQATAVTEVRLPREVMLELDQFPNRRVSVRKRDEAEEGTAAAEMSPPSAAGDDRAHDRPDECAPELPTDPFPGLTGRERARAIEALTREMSPTEVLEYQEALRLHHAQMRFDEDSKMSSEQKMTVLKVLTSLATPAAQTPPKTLPATQPLNRTTHERTPPRKLSVFELARLKRDLQTATSAAEAPELLRQVIWSIDGGALKRFSALHAAHIALKKIRGGAWTRPHRMPPNWVPTFCAPSAHETCRRA